MSPQDSLPVPKHIGKPLRGGTCRGCGAAVLWATMASGRGNPLDREPVDDGNVAQVDMVRGGEIVGQFGIVLTNEALDLAREKGVTLRRSHFATCPARDRHRKGGAR